MPRRSGLVVAVIAFGVAVGVPAAASAARSSSTRAAGFNVSYTPGTVVIAPSVVAQQLVNVSADGNTFTFKSDAGALASLKAGSIMLLQNKAVGVVSSVSHSGGQFVVATQPASIPQVIKSGTVDLSAPITFAGGVTTSQTEPTPDVTFAAARATAANAAAARRAEERTVLRMAGAISGKAGPITYSATISRASDKLDFSVTYSFDKNGLLGTVTAQGYLDTFDAQLSMLIQNSQVKSSQFLARPLNGHMHVTWQLGRGDTSKYSIKLPVFKFPFAFSFPFYVGGFPFFVKVGFQTLFTIAITGKSGTMQGGVDLDYNGNAGAGSSGASISTSGSETISGQFLNGLKSLTLGGSGALIAFDAPTVTVGMGLPTGLNGTTTIGVITALGQTTGSAVAGQSCSKYDLAFTIKGSLGAQLFGKAVTLASKDIYSTSLSRTQGVGC